MILHSVFNFLRKFNADAPGFHEARWALKRCSHSGPTERVLKHRSRGRSLKTIAQAEKCTEERVRQLLIQGASRARTTHAQKER